MTRRTRWLWPLASRLVERRRLGSAIAVLTVGLNLGIAGANLAAGYLNDRFGAGALNPEGYGPMMGLFLACGAAGFLCALQLLRIEGDAHLHIRGRVP